MPESDARSVGPGAVRHPDYQITLSVSAAVDRWAERGGEGGVGGMGAGGGGGARS